MPSFLFLSNAQPLSPVPYQTGKRYNASNAINIFGVSPTAGYSSGLFTRTSGEGQGGNITINTQNFRVADGGVVDALPTAKGNGGNVTVTANTFEALNGGQVLTTTRSSGNAGNITVDATNSITLSGSDLTFAARIARFPTNVDNEGATSGLFANTEQGSTGNGGNLTLKTRQLNVSNGASLTVSSRGTGNAGNLFIYPDLVRLDRGTLIGETKSGESANITIQGGSIQLSNKSLISTTASGSGNGGNITINADTLVGLENSDIVANAFKGRGGNIQIMAQGIFRSPDSEINASSQLGINGTVQINTLGINPSLGLVNLPVQPVNVTGLIAQGCPTDVGPRASKFVITGRGGLPPTPREAVRSEPALADLGTPIQGQENHASAATYTKTTRTEAAPIVEATGWVTNAKGEVELVATAPTVTPDIPWLMPTTCHAP